MAELQPQHFGVNEKTSPALCGCCASENERLTETKCTDNFGGKSNMESWEFNTNDTATKLETENKNKACYGNGSEKSISRCYVTDQPPSCKNSENIFSVIGNNPDFDVELQTFNSIVRQPQTVDSGRKNPFDMKTCVTVKEPKSTQIYTNGSTLGLGNQNLNTKNMGHRTCSRLQVAGETQETYRVGKIPTGRVDDENTIFSETESFSALKVCDTKIKHSIAKHKIGTTFNNRQKDPVEEESIGPSPEMGLASNRTKLAVVETENSCEQDLRCGETCNESSFENITQCDTDHLNTRRCSIENLEANDNNGEEMRNDIIISMGSRGHYVTPRQSRRDLFEKKNTSENANVNYREEMINLSSGSKDCEDSINRENGNSKQQVLKYSENYHDVPRRTGHERNYQTNTQCSGKSNQNYKETTITSNQNYACDDKGDHNKIYSVRETTSKRSESANGENSSFSGNERNSKNRDVIQLSRSSSEDRGTAENWRNCDEEQRNMDAEKKYNRWNFHLRWNRETVKRRITPNASNRIFEPSGRSESKDTIYERRNNKRCKENPYERPSKDEEHECCGNRKSHTDENVEYGESKRKEHNFCDKRRSHSKDRFDLKEDKDIDKETYASAPSDECHSRNCDRSDITCRHCRRSSNMGRFHRRSKSPSEELGGNKTVTGTNYSQTEHSQSQSYVSERREELQSAILKSKRNENENLSKECKKQDSSAKRFGRERKVEEFNSSKDRYGNERSRIRSKSSDRYVRFRSNERDERRTAKQWSNTRSDCGRHRPGYRGYLSYGLNREENNKGQESRRELDERSEEGERKQKITYTKEQNNLNNERLSRLDPNIDSPKATSHTRCTYEDPPVLSFFLKMKDTVMTSADIQNDQETENLLAKGVDTTDQSLTNSNTMRNEENLHWRSVSIKETGQTSVVDTKNMTGKKNITNESKKTTFVESRRANPILQNSSNILQEDESIYIPSACKIPLAHGNENLPSRNEDIVQSCLDITRKYEVQQKQMGSVSVDNVLGTKRVFLAGEMNQYTTPNHTLRLTTKEYTTRCGKEMNEEAHHDSSKRKQAAAEQRSKDVGKTNRLEHCARNYDSCNIKPAKRSVSEADQIKESRRCFSKRRKEEGDDRTNDYNCGRRNRNVFVYKKHGKRIFTRWEPYCLVSPKSRSDYDEDMKLKWPDGTNSNYADDKEETAERRDRETVRRKNSRETVRRQPSSEDSKRDHKTTSKGKRQLSDRNEPGKDSGSDVVVQIKEQSHRSDQNEQDKEGGKRMSPWEDSDSDMKVHTKNKRCGKHEQELSQVHTLLSVLAREYVEKLHGYQAVTNKGLGTGESCKPMIQRQWYPSVQEWVTHPSPDEINPSEEKTKLRQNHELVWNVIPRFSQDLVDFDNERVSTTDLKQANGCRVSISEGSNSSKEDEEREWMSSSSTVLANDARNKQQLSPDVFVNTPRSGCIPSTVNFVYTTAVAQMTYREPLLDLTKSQEEYQPVDSTDCQEDFTKHCTALPLPSNSSPPRDSSSMNDSDTLAFLETSNTSPVMPLESSVTPLDVCFPKQKNKTDLKVVDKVSSFNELPRNNALATEASSIESGSNYGNKTCIEHGVESLLGRGFDEPVTTADNCIVTCLASSQPEDAVAAVVNKPNGISTSAFLSSSKDHRTTTKTNDHHSCHVQNDHCMPSSHFYTRASDSRKLRGIVCEARTIFSRKKSANNDAIAIVYPRVSDFSAKLDCINVEKSQEELTSSCERARNIPRCTKTRCIQRVQQQAFNQNQECECCYHVQQQRNRQIFQRQHEKKQQQQQQQQQYQQQPQQQYGQCFSSANCIPYFGGLTTNHSAQHHLSLYQERFLNTEHHG